MSVDNKKFIKGCRDAGGETYSDVGGGKVARCEFPNGVVRVINKRNDTMEIVARKNNDSLVIDEEDIDLDIMRNGHKLVFEGDEVTLKADIGPERVNYLRLSKEDRSIRGTIL